MFGRRDVGSVATVPLVVVRHAHRPDECGVAFAAWNGFASPLRRGSALCSCRQGAHEILIVVEAEDAEAALALVPPWIAARAEATSVDEVPIP